MYIIYIYSLILETWFKHITRHRKFGTESSSVHDCSWSGGYWDFPRQPLLHLPGLLWTSCPSPKPFAHSWDQMGLIMRDTLNKKALNSAVKTMRKHGPHPLDEIGKKWALEFNINKGGSSLILYWSNHWGIEEQKHCQAPHLRLIKYPSCDPEISVQQPQFLPAMACGMATHLIQKWSFIPFIVWQRLWRWNCSPDHWYTLASLQH